MYFYLYNYINYMMDYIHKIVIFNINIINNKLYLNKIILIFVLYLCFKLNKKNNNKFKINDANNPNFNLIEFNKFYIFDKVEMIYIYTFKPKLNINLKNKIVSLEYNIGFFNKNKILISPYELLLYNNIRLFCQIEINNDIKIESISNIIENKYFNCIEFFIIKEKIKISTRINIKNDNRNFSYIYYFEHNYLNYKNYIKLNVVNNTNHSLLEKIRKFELNNFINNHPNILLKRYSINNFNEWNFTKIYNHYFCFCIGQYCQNKDISQKCKYYFYITIIENNQNLYKKSDFLFVDFIYSKYPPDDTFPVFKQMDKQRFPVHYITERKDIYNEYCLKIKKCLKIIQVNSKIYYNYGDFLEKYLILILKLKAVISGKRAVFHYISLLFYNVEYITYICVGHGVCYFKDFLYHFNRLYGCKKNNKILLPPSEKIISIAKKYGWKDENIIKINLPRWDKYNSNIYKNKYILFDNEKIKNCIFIMFTWRGIRKGKAISSHYIKNIIILLKNDILNKKLKKNKILLYFTVHRFIQYKYKKIFIKILKKYKYLKFISQNNISDCLMKANLVVSDFSSIIFDLMYQKKPFIIYIPDGNDPKISNIYTFNYYRIIKKMKNGKFHFKNIFFNIIKVIKKIIFYINNNFQVEPNLIKFYDSFGLKIGNNIPKFIKYLKEIN